VGFVRWVFLGGFFNANPGSWASLTLDPRKGNKSGSVFGMNNQDHISEGLENIFLS
jgi:hypothetical protein